MEEHLVAKEPFTVITVDHNGKYRVATKNIVIFLPPNGNDEFRHSQPLRPDGFLSERDSISWLKKHGYQVVKLQDRYTVKKKDVLNINHPQTLFTTLPEKGVILKYVNGKLYVKIDN